MAVFKKEDELYAVPIGYEKDGDYKIYSDEMFFIEDPHDLYKHWTPDVWQAVEQHQVKPGMNEVQADFAIGMGMPDAGSSSEEKTVHHPNGGKPLVNHLPRGKGSRDQTGFIRVIAAVGDLKSRWSASKKSFLDWVKVIDRNFDGP